MIKYLTPDTSEQRVLQMLTPTYPLCKTEVIWILEWIKKKVAAEDQKLLDLSQPLLLKSFLCFAEAALFMIHQPHRGDHEIDRLRASLSELVLIMQINRA